MPQNTPFTYIGEEEQTNQYTVKTHVEVPGKRKTLLTAF